MEKTLTILSVFVPSIIFTDAICERELQTAATPCRLCNAKPIWQAQFIDAQKQRRPEGRQTYFYEHQQNFVELDLRMTNYTGPINWACTSCEVILLSTSCDENASVSYLTNMRW